MYYVCLQARVAVIAAKEAKVKEIEELKAEAQQKLKELNNLYNWRIQAKREEVCCRGLV